MRIAIGTDHAGFEMKEFLRGRLAGAGHTVLDMGTHSAAAVDYPDFIRPVAESVLLGLADRGIVLGGSGQGECIAANKFPGIRCALCHDTYTARMSPAHNNANVLSLGARVVGPELAWDVVDTWLRNEYSGEERHARRLAKVAAWERERSFPLRQLARHGQSVWCDYIERRMLTGGELRRLVLEGVAGVTSNPTIFEKAVSGTDDYDDDIRALTARGLSPQETVEAITLADIRETAAQLRPVYDLTQGADGFASLELPPDLAHDTRGSIEKAGELWRHLGAPNAMIKVPGTLEGVPAIAELTAAGINVNVTLLFSLESYEAAARAYIAGLEKRVRAGLPVDRVASVASFFVSRVDTAVDSLIQERIAGPLRTRGGPLPPGPANLLGKAAIANSKMAYRVFQRLFSGPAWEALLRRGARPQRVLWASTSTKDPTYRDVRYVEELIGPHTVNTMPPATLTAFLEHGYVRPSLEEGLEEAQSILDGLREAGIDLASVTERLLAQGVSAFSGSYNALVTAVAARGEVPVAGAVG